MQNAESKNRRQFGGPPKKTSSVMFMILSAREDSLVVDFITTSSFDGRVCLPALATNKKNKSSKFTVDESTNNSEMAPIEMPKQTVTVQKLALQKKVEIPNANQFSLDKFINWNEEKLIKTLGKSHFVV